MALGVVIFGATLILLFGALNLVRRTEPGAALSSATPVAQRSTPPSATPDPTASGSSAAGSSSPGPSSSTAPTTDVVLVGAGDIASCGSDADSATAALVEGIPGAVFTAGDNA